jgi:hypothetical protein
MNGLHEAFDEIVADVPVFGDLDLAVAQAERERRRRAGMIAGLVATAAVVAVIAGALAVTRGARTATPINPATSTPTSAGTVPAADRILNGRIQTAEEYLGRVAARCDDCYWPGTVFDQADGTLLVIDSDPRDRDVTGIRVFGPDGQVASLACPTDFACPRSYLMDLGPGPEEISMVPNTNTGEVQVLGFDGNLRRTIDVSGAVGENELAYLSGLAWSPDGHRLAVQTRARAQAQIWLFDRDGSEPSLLHTASSTEGYPRVAVTCLSWSPDGSRLGFVEEHWNMAAEFGRPRSEISESTKAVSLLLPDADGGRPAAARTLYEYTKDRHPLYDDDAPSAFLWSPDGARVAVRFYDELLELSAEDGTVLAEDPFIEDVLVWPAKQP